MAGAAGLVLATWAIAAPRVTVATAIPTLTGRARRPISTRFHYGLGDVLVVVQVGLAVALVLTSAFMVRIVRPTCG